MKASATLEIGIDSLPNGTMDVQVQRRSKQGQRRRPTLGSLAVIPGGAAALIGSWKCGEEQHSKEEPKWQGLSTSRFCKTLASGNGVRPARIWRLPTPRLSTLFGLPDRLDDARAAV